MYARVCSTVLVVAAGALVVAPASASAAPGAIPLAFLRNQGQYCSLICPYVVQGAVTVPLGVLQVPTVFLSASSLPRAIGAAAAAVTGPADVAAEGIILNDVDHVVPKAFNNLEVAVVQLSDVGSAIVTPGRLPAAIGTARREILDALSQPLPPPDPTQTGATTLPQVVAVETIKVSAAVAFEAGELVLLGVVQTADAGAQELARTGNPSAAVTAAVGEADTVVRVAANIVTDSVNTATKNIGAALHTKARSTSSRTANPTKLKASVRTLRNTLGNLGKSLQHKKSGSSATSSPRTSHGG